MPKPTTKKFSTTLENFKTKISRLEAAKKKRLVLIVMSNTDDATLKIGCVKDAAAVKETFEEICAATDYHFCGIEISGKNYTSENLFNTLESVGHFNDVTVFYYSGHGFTYKNGRRYKYPQIDMRKPNKKPDFNKMDFIEKNTANLKVLLQIMRLKGGRVNIAIADCCNTVIPFTRKKASATEINIADDIMVAPAKKFTKKLYADQNNEVGVLVSSSTYGQPAIANNETGSIFTHHFTKTIKGLLSKRSISKQYFPWIKVLKMTSQKAFKESREYDIGNGVAGKQKAVFEVYLESDVDYDKRMTKHGW